LARSKTVTRRPRAASDTPTLDSTIEDLKQYRALGRQVKTIGTRVDDFKTKLRKSLERLGEPDDKGSLWIEFPEEVDGVVKLCHQRRVSTKLNEDRAIDILNERGIRDDCTDTHVTIDSNQLDAVFAALRKAGIYDQVVTTSESINDEKVMGFYADGKLSAEDIDAMFTQSITWAFIPMDANGKSASL
jgi:hypothetical protein